MSGRIVECHLGYQLLGVYICVLLIPNNARGTSPIIVTIKVSRKFLLVMAIVVLCPLRTSPFHISLCLILSDSCDLVMIIVTQGPYLKA